MRSVDVNVHRREPVLKTLIDEALRGEVITFIKFVTANDTENARIAFQTSRVELDPIQQMCDARESALWIFQSHAPDDSMDLITQREQILRQITSVLGGDTGD